MADKKSTRKPIKKPGKKKPKTSKRIKKVQPGVIPSLKNNLQRTFKTVRIHHLALLRVTSVYAVLYFIMVRVLTNVDLDQLNQSIVLIFGGGQETVYTNILTVGSLFGESTNFDNESGLMFAIIAVVCSLAVIWVLRSIWSQRKVSVKEAYYEGMYPLIPFVLVILFMLIQLIPFSIGTFVFQTAFNQGLTVSFIEKLFFISIFAGGVITSGYYLIGSIVASYAVTVPGVSPSQARKSAKKMLVGRRFAVLKQVIIFVLLTGMLVLAPMLLIIWLIPAIAIVAAALFIVLSLPWFHLYFYGLYRDLLNE